MLKEIKNKIDIKQLLLICFILLLVISIFVIGLLIARIEKLKEPGIILPDTTTNTTQLGKIKDSINLIEKEIINYKTEYIYEKKYAESLNDSSAIQLFFKLTSE